MNLADRITRRLLMEPPLIFDDNLGHIPETARIAAMEAEDSCLHRSGYGDFPKDVEATP